MGEWLQVTYRVRARAEEIAVRAQALALEQSVEMALEAVTNPWVRDHVAGRVETITRAHEHQPGEGDVYNVVVRLSAITVGPTPRSC